MSRSANEPDRCGRSDAGTRTIDIEDEVIVRADVNDEILRLLSQAHALAKVKHADITLRGIRTVNPLRLPAALCPVLARRDLTNAS